MATVEEIAALTEVELDTGLAAGIAVPAATKTIPALGAHKLIIECDTLIAHVAADGGHVASVDLTRGRTAAQITTIRRLLKGALLAAHTGAK